MLEIFTSVSVSNSMMVAFARSVANPDAISTLVSLLVSASPKIKYLVTRILSSLIQMKLPVELFETAIQQCLKDQNSIVSNMFSKVQPTLKFKKSKFLAFLHQYALSIRQKVWVKTAVES